jgi:hypothetical protein
MTKTDFAIRLLMEAYADEGVVDLVNMFEWFMHYVSENHSKFGTPEENDQKLRLNDEQPSLLIFETIADISYAAGAVGFDSGDSRADVQHFIHLARVFEEETKYVDWEAEDGVDYITEIDEFIAEKIGVKKDKLNFDYPEGAKALWDALEIAGCVDNGEDTYPVEDDEKPDFYTVYLHQVEGGVMAIADLPTEEHAQKLSELIHNAVISFKDNGYMPMNRNELLHRKFNLFLDERIHMAHTTSTKAAYEVVKDMFNNMVKP